MTDTPIKKGDTLYVAWFTDDDAIEITPVTVTGAGHISIIVNRDVHALGTRRVFAVESVDGRNGLSRTREKAIELLLTKTRLSVERTEAQLKRQRALLAIFDKPTGETP